MKDEARERLFDEFIQTLNRMSPEERAAFVYKYRNSFCIHCGSNDPHCQCWNDE